MNDVHYSASPGVTSAQQCLCPFLTLFQCRWVISTSTINSSSYRLSVQRQTNDLNSGRGKLKEKWFFFFSSISERLTGNVALVQNGRRSWRNKPPKTITRQTPVLPVKRRVWEFLLQGWTKFPMRAHATKGDPAGSRTLTKMWPFIFLSDRLLLSTPSWRLQCFLQSQVLTFTSARLWMRLQGTYHAFPLLLHATQNPKINRFAPYYKLFFEFSV